MKILHTADWHLGKKLYDRDRITEQQAVLKEIHEIAETHQVDCILVAGDLYDKINPSNEAIELFYHSLKKMSCNGQRPVIAIAGNHDSPDRIDAPLPLAKECGILLIGKPLAEHLPFEMESGFSLLRSAPGFVELKLPNSAIPLRLICTPFANEIRLKEQFAEDQEEELRSFLSSHWHKLADQYFDQEGVNMLTAHLFVCEQHAAPPEEPEGEKPIAIGSASMIFPENIPQSTQYTALGHLHRSHSVGKKERAIYYSGSPLAYSFSEANQQKFAHLVQVEPGQDAEIERIELKSPMKLLRAAFDEIESALHWLNEHHDAYTEITMRTEKYLSANQMAALYEASGNLLNVIPEPLMLDGTEKSAIGAQSLDKSITELFTDYFHSVHGNEPSEDLYDILKEAIQLKGSS